MYKTNFAINGNILTATREFDAPLALVWRAWTEAELLDQWWAPQPWKSETSRMDFKEGGERLYAMVGPEGEKHWGLTGYETINKPSSFAGTDSFCDDQGTVNPAMPVANFVNAFSGEGSRTLVTMTTTYPSEEQVKMVVEMGMKEGLSLAFEHLDDLLGRL